MIDFDHHRASTVAEAVRLGQQPGAAYVAGGSNLVDLMKGHVMQPVLLVDITRLPLNEVTLLPDGGLRIGALVRNSDLANHPLVRQRHPLLAQALLSGASPQLRNMATVGGNLMQRTRCHYFYDTGFRACNKREPGSGCAARDGHNRIHAVLGASAHCVAVNPSDMNVALAALRAQVIVQGAQAERRVPLADFHRLPGDTPQRDTTLQPGELILAVELPPLPFAAHACYLKLRDRASYAFALVSVAAALEVANGTVKNAALALGGVAHKPWRRVEAEQALVGRALSPQGIAQAADLLLEGAQPLAHNAFKVELARRAVARALQRAGGAA